MAHILPNKKLFEAAVKRHSKGQTFAEMGRDLGISSTTIRYWINNQESLRTKLENQNIIVPAGASVPEAVILKDKIRTLEAQIKSAAKEQLDAHYVRTKIFKLAESESAPPSWLIKPGKGASAMPGVPTLMLSDWHWGEIIDPTQIGGVNMYNVALAHERARLVVANAIKLLKEHVVNPNYPGIVVILGGDMVSGDIHEELVATNEMEIMPTVVDLHGVLRWVIQTLANAFGKVIVQCVSGNHGRNTFKIRAKGRAFTSFDWLLYQWLETSFNPVDPITGKKGIGYDDRVQFVIPNGPDLLYKVFDYRYLLTHGDQFRGGDSMIGCLGPLTRGDHKKRSRNSQIGANYDTMVVGHYHTLMMLKYLIVNGCFPVGSMVSTPNGFKQIENCVIGDKVISRDGSVQEVSHVFEKQSDNGLVHLKIRGICAPLTATPNHLIWAVKAESKKCNSVGAKWDALIGKGDRPQWIPADFISPGDYVHIPRMKDTISPIDAETAWAYGLYLAEGSTLLEGGASKKHNRIVLTMHEKELEVLKRFAKWFDTTYGTTSAVYIRTRPKGGVTSEFRVSPGKDICIAFRNMFGHRANGKYLPEGYIALAPLIGRALLQGWIDGDGHTSKVGDTTVTTISKTLAYQMFTLALNVGLRPSLGCLSAGGPRKSDSYSILFNSGQESIEIDNELFYRVHARYRDNSVQKVFDLEVTGEHTYVVNNIGVHNSLCGYNEYAFQNNFKFEPPQQALWLTHPDHGITISMPVFATGSSSKPMNINSEWVSWKDDKRKK